jgi:predicted RNase H-like HicB family nuclease
MEKSIKTQVEYYLKLPYTMTIQYEDEQGGYYVAGYLELPDLTMTGSTPEEAIKELLLEAPEWFELIRYRCHLSLQSIAAELISACLNSFMPRWLLSLKKRG